jgi:hypothetical protein
MPAAAIVRRGYPDVLDLERDRSALGAAFL